MPNKMRTLLVLLLIILKETGPTKACSSSCSSDCDCGSRGLSSVPQDLPTDITRLTLMLPFKQKMDDYYAFERQITCAGPGNLSRKSLLREVNHEDLICEQTSTVSFSTDPSTVAEVSTPTSSTKLTAHIAVTSPDLSAATGKIVTVLKEVLRSHPPRAPLPLEMKLVNRFTTRMSQ
ncbi:hypothetical protein Bbelb_322740 [Branchiostoma belcheri]|nr:hypothetical protein Bbelb_322740 [Branchiostoma belcheri]